jgi:hypothetical protein
VHKKEGRGKLADAQSVLGGAMKRSSALLMIFIILGLTGCSRKASPEAKRTETDQPQEVQSEDSPVKPATPDDPGSPGAVVVPLQVLEKQAKASLAKAPVPQKALPVDHSDYLEAGKPRSFLHKVFSLNKNADFGFEIPPHQWNARLRGNFRSFTKRSSPDSTSDRTADIDIVLLNEQEFNNFLHGQPPNVTYELDSAHSQIIDWRIPTTYGDPQVYHLIFCNSGRTKTKFVEADFLVSFE